MLATYIDLHTQGTRGRYFQIVVPLSIKDAKDAMLVYRPFVLLYHVTNAWGSTLTEVNEPKVPKA